MPRQPVHDDADCWMADCTDDKAQAVFELIDSALTRRPDLITSPGVLFAGIWEAAIRAFAVGTVDAGDDREVIAAHLEAVTRDFIKTSCDFMEVYREHKKHCKPEAAH